LSEHFGPETLSEGTHEEETGFLVGKITSESQRQLGWLVGRQEFIS
jgi:hypothetical protein